MDQHQVVYEVREHKPVYTSIQMAKFLGTDEDRIAKSMILKSGKDHFLAVLPGKLRIDFGKLDTILDTKSVCLAPASEAEDIAECSVGSVHPFGNLINCRTYFEKELLTSDYVFFNPSSHTKSIRIKTTDLVELVKPSIIEFAKPPSTEQIHL